MKLLSKGVSATMIVATASSFASTAHAIPLNAGSLALRAAAAPLVETVQWRGWGGWRGGWGGWRGGWGWGGLGAGIAAGAIIGGALAAGPYYSGYYTPYYGSPYYYSPAYYGYYAPTYYGDDSYYGGYGYWPYRAYGLSYPRIWYGLGHRRVSIRHY